MREMCRVLTHLPAANVQYTLLRYCLDGCRLASLLRATPATHVVQEVGAHGLAVDIGCPHPEAGGPGDQEPGRYVHPCSDGQLC